MFDWLRERLEPPPRWAVGVDGELIWMTDDCGETRSIAKAALVRVAIETRERGLEGMDHWWLLFGEGDLTGCVYPLGAVGEAAVADYFKTLPGFDHGEMVKALTSTTSVLVTLWRREP